MYRKILLPTDGSKYSRKVVKHALHLAERGKSEIIILHVLEDINTQAAALPISTLPTPMEHLSEELEDQGKAIIADMERQIQEECPGGCANTTISSRIRLGKPYLEILKLQEEEGVDLVVMGASGKHGLDRLILGSVTERVVKESKTPVLIIP